MIRRPWSTLFIDTVLCFAVLMVCLVNPPVPPGAFEPPRATFTLSMSWDWTPERVDMDWYVRLPDGRTAWFRYKDQGLVFIDRDHLGRENEGRERREDVEFLSPVAPGSYLVAVENYHGPAEGQIRVELRDAAGIVRWKWTGPVPEQGKEIPLGEFTFAPGNLLDRIEPTQLSVVALTRRGQ